MLAWPLVYRLPQSLPELADRTQQRRCNRVVTVPAVYGDVSMICSKKASYRYTRVIHIESLIGYKPLQNCSALTAFDTCLQVKKVEAFALYDSLCYCPLQAFHRPL